MTAGCIKNYTLPPGGMLDLVSIHYLEINLSFTLFNIWIGWKDWRWNSTSGLNGWSEDQTLRPGWMLDLDGLKMKLCLLVGCRIWSQIGILQLIFRWTRRDWFHQTLVGDVLVDGCWLLSPGKVEQQSWKSLMSSTQSATSRWLEKSFSSQMEEEQNIPNCQNGDNNMLPAGTLKISPEQNRINFTSKST